MMKAEANRAPISRIGPARMSSSSTATSSADSDDVMSAPVKGNVEIPSDLQGVIYVTMDDREGWHLQLAREMKAAGMEVDLNRAL